MAIKEDDGQTPYIEKRKVGRLGGGEGRGGEESGCWRTPMKFLFVGDDVCWDTMGQP